ncbi:MAG: response regulator [Elusimicrobia bacterium]|nr:response regulator [Elusimicrobiota bacterium]
MWSRAIQVLLVEDDPEYARLLAEAVKASDGRVQLTTVDDGQKAVDFVRRRQPYSLARRPDLILLDLHLPRKPGLEVLHELKGDATLRVIPVIALTTSSDERDIWEAYAAGCNCYVTKPIELADFCRLVRLLSDFWGAAVLPPAGPRREN